jgi:hypothetical protein
MDYQGSCHCGAIQFEFTGPQIDGGLRCNCSICIRKGALMTAYTIAPEAITITVRDDALATYTFGTGVARHHFCKHCGIYTFHETIRAPGDYRVNIGCVAGVDAMQLPVTVFAGATLL